MLFYHITATYYRINTDAKTAPNFYMSPIVNLLKNAVTAKFVDKLKSTSTRGQRPLQALNHL